MPPMVICNTVTAMPHPRAASTRDACRRCHVEVWVADTSREAIKLLTGGAGGEPEILCARCGAAALAADPGPVELATTNAQVAEVRGLVGFDVVGRLGVRAGVPVRNLDKEN